MNWQRNISVQQQYNAAVGSTRIVCAHQEWTSETLCIKTSGKVFCFGKGHLPGIFKKKKSNLYKTKQTDGSLMWYMDQDWLPIDAGNL